MAKKAATPAKKAPAKKPAAKAAPKQRRPSAGRPSLYKNEYADQAYKYCLLGATDERLAELFGVNPDTVHEWKKVHPKFSESITRGKEIADAEIAASLFHRAKGYSHPEVHVSNYQGEVTLTPLTKHYPPDTPAASLWLRNRQPKIWRDKVDVEHAGQNGGPIKTEGSLNVTITPEDAYKRMLGGA